jgi:hypothetical protein
MRDEQKSDVWLGSGPDVTLQKLERQLFVAPTS